LNQSLKILTLSENRIGDKGADVLRNVLMRRYHELSLIRLEKLDLSHNKIRRLGGWEEILKLRWISLELDFSYNEIGDHEMKNHGRELLWYFVKLNSQKCDRVGAEVKNGEQMVHGNDHPVGNRKEVSNELQENINVETLDLNADSIGKTGAVATVDPLEGNERLEALNLLWYFIKLNSQKCGRVGAKVKNGEQMVHGNDRPVGNREEVSSELQENINVETLDLNADPVGETGTIAN